MEQVLVQFADVYWGMLLIHPGDFYFVSACPQRIRTVHCGGIDNIAEHHAGDPGSPPAMDMF